MFKKIKDKWKENDNTVRGGKFSIRDNPSKKNHNNFNCTSNHFRPATKHMEALLLLGLLAVFAPLP